MKRNEVEEADIVISSHGYDDHVRDAVENCHRTEAFFGNYEMCLVTQAHVLELNDHAFPLNPDDSDLADVQINSIQAFHNSGLLSPKLVLGSVPVGHYFHSADHVVLYYPLIMVLRSAISLIPMLSMI